MKINQILEALELSVIQYHVDLRIDEAQRQFMGNLQRIKIKDEREFITTVSSFYDCMRQFLYGANVAMPQHFLFSEVRDFLNKANRNGGYVQLAREAILGSVMPALNLVCEEFKRQATNEYFQGVLVKHIPQLSYEEREKITLQLMEKLSAGSSLGNYELPLLVQRLEEMVMQYANHVNSLRRSIGRV